MTGRASVSALRERATSATRRARRPSLSQRAEPWRCLIEPPHEAPKIRLTVPLVPTTTLSTPRKRSSITLRPKPPSRAVSAIAFARSLLSLLGAIGRPESRSVQPPESGRVVAVPRLAGCIIGTLEQHKARKQGRTLSFDERFGLTVRMPDSVLHFDTPRQFFLIPRNLPCRARWRLPSTLERGLLCRSLGARR